MASAFPIAIGPSVTPAAGVSAAVEPSGPAFDKGLHTLGRDHGLGPGPVQAPRITPVFGKGNLARDDVRADVDKVQAGREVVAVSEQNTGAQPVVRFQRRVG